MNNLLYHLQCPVAGFLLMGGLLQLDRADALPAKFTVTKL